jgi:hypothetical protein
MNEDDKRIFFLIIKSPIKVHLNHLIAKSFNNIGSLLAIVKPFT